MQDIIQFYPDLLQYARINYECNECDAKDLIQETYLGAYESDNFEGKSDIKTWLIGIMENIWKDNLKKFKPKTIDLNNEANQRLINDAELPLKNTKKPSLSEIEG